MVASWLRIGAGTPRRSSSPAGGMLAMPFSPVASAGPTRLAFRVSTMADRSIGPARSGAQAALSRTEASS